MSPNVAQIAAGLTKDECFALFSGRWNLRPYVAKFIGLGLVGRVQSKRQPLMNLALTSRGRAVRQFLQDQEHDHG